MSTLSFSEKANAKIRQNLNLDFIIIHIMFGVFSNFCPSKKEKLWQNVHKVRISVNEKMSQYPHNPRNVISICRNQHFFTVVAIKINRREATVKYELLSQSHAHLNRFSLCLSYHKTSTESYTQSKKLSDSNRIRIKGICFICSEQFFSICFVAF